MPEQNPLSERIERDVRTLIGDLQMQIIVLRSMLDMQRAQAQAQEQPQQPRANGDAREHPAP